MVIAFRGSDINMRTEGSLADLCFDTMLLNSEYGGIAPAKFCSQFESSMDYFTQAKEVCAQASGFFFVVFIFAVCKKLNGILCLYRLSKRQLISFKSEELF